MTFNEFNLKKFDQNNIFLAQIKVSSTNCCFVIKNTLLVIFDNNIYDVENSKLLSNYENITYMEPITVYFKNKNKYRFNEDENGCIYLDVDDDELIFYQEFKKKLYEDVFMHEDFLKCDPKNKVYLNYLKKDMYE